MNNILHITGYALRGGCEKNCYHFIHGSPSFKHEVVVLDKPGPMTSEWQDTGVTITHLDSLQTDLFQFRKKLAAFLTDKFYDLVICWSTIRLPLQLNALNGKTHHCKVYLGNPIGTAHRLWKDVLLAMLFPAQIKVTLMACSAYVAESYRNAPYFKAFPVKVSLNPIALPGAFPKKSVTDAKFKIGMVARLDPIKDHETVIRGFGIFKKNIPDAELHLAGDGILRDKLELLTSHLGLTNSVFFYGDVKNVYGLLNQWNVFAYATTPEEGLGSVVAEAMANGLACVLSDLPMLRELAPHADLAEWFRAGDEKEFSAAILRLYQDKKRTEELSLQSFEYARNNFGAERFINDYVNG